MVKLRTVYDPTAPVGFQWTAIDDETCDGPESPIGTGATEAEAIDDLRAKMDEPLRAYPTTRSDDAG